MPGFETELCNTVDDVRAHYRYKNANTSLDIRGKMSEPSTSVPVNRITFANPPAEDEPSRHCLVRNCRYSFGQASGRDRQCSYCLEDLEANNTCNNYKMDCFDEVPASNRGLDHVMEG